jgi:hypothetical protein
MAEERFLSECWTMYFHDPDHNQWTPSSYKIIGHISTVQDWCYNDASFMNLWYKGMFFIMREHIQPLWEDPLNKNGGCFSFKVNKNDAGEYWFRLGALLLGGNLGKKSEVQDKICGISISPKRNYCILRVWLQDHEYNSTEFYNLEIPVYSQVMYKSHTENSDFENTTTDAPLTDALAPVETAVIPDKPSLPVKDRYERPRIRHNKNSG